MRLEDLYRQSDKGVFLEYSRKLSKFMFNSNPRVINEARITITVDDDAVKPSISTPPPEPRVIHHHHGSGIPEETKIKFIDGATKLGNFGDAEWVNQLLRGMKQAGVQGFNEIKEDESPVSRAEIRQLIGLLVNLISDK